MVHFITNRAASSASAIIETKPPNRLIDVSSSQGFSCERKIKEKPFYVTARVKKEGVQALSLRLHKSTVKNVQGKYIF